MLVKQVDRNFRTFMRYIIWLVLYLIDFTVGLKYKILLNNLLIQFYLNAGATISARFFFGVP